MAQTENYTSALLADQLERAFRGGAWHGPAVMELLLDADGALAQWRPGPPSHSIAETVGHLTHWLDDVRRQLIGAPRSPVATGADWGPSELDSEGAWQALRSALEEVHGQLREAVLRLEDHRLDEAAPGSDTTIRGLLLGTLQHNAYHAGQIALVRKLAEAARREEP